ncbi:MarR family transcriptional regulator [Nostoc linckia z18]|jgi:DNA-binding HxlR family transcriptional regulator|uniref:MarR family transcriptional regulator n=3 Tax=Nostoc TaxID=1177 RepID=A0A9Q6EMP4_NOSLI|nr:MULTISPECIES: helix-turn-helix domain-containing protein [Nostoc]MBL1197659.1 helix-turn-helix transcriptional regulator [Nostoc sp. GBBB01]MDZ8015371.1 helix-turn-helix domain-containing protein [Nostoc sp. ZfuVER08]PHK41327.1 MarR family transcriptional regulator [Nostoc linckia z15]PHK47513.1 MarR family transcriptional regulator [Nostoc linckia z16]MBD2614106.1 helix-turn-helix transcriptional regulator [Nostoc punctiforme FACHB-252]
MPEQQTEGTLFVQTTLKILGGKWKILILWHLKDEVKRYSQLKKLIPEITEKMLIQQLRELENDGIVNRKVYSDIPPKVEYSFTEYGKTLIPVLKALCDWGQEHLKNYEAGSDGNARTWGITND